MAEIKPKDLPSLYVQCNMSGSVVCARCCTQTKPKDITMYFKLADRDEWIGVCINCTPQLAASILVGDALLVL